MKRNAKSLRNFTIGATDGEIGKVKDFYFDDHTWTIRYLVVETGNWLSGRKVLISPQALLTPNWDEELLPAKLTMDQVKNSPDIDTEKTVSRQQEMELTDHYTWPGYWAGGLWASGMGTSGMMMQAREPLEEAVQEAAHEDGDPNLRSIQDVQDYAIQASDDSIGEVEDFIINDENWRIDYMVVDTGNWFPGKKVLIAPSWIKEINWNESEVLVNATQDQVKESPEYKPGEAISDDYDASLQEYYGRFR